MNEYGAMLEWYWEGNPSRYKILSQCLVIHYKYHITWPGIQNCSSHCVAFPNYNIPQTYFVNIFCFQVLYTHTFSHTPPHSTWVLVVCAPSVSCSRITVSSVLLTVCTPFSSTNSLLLYAAPCIGPDEGKHTSENRLQLCTDAQRRVTQKCLYDCTRPKKHILGTVQMLP